MPQGCTVPNCTSRYGTAEKISMYRFPLTKPELVERWLQAIKKPNWVPTKNSRICCHHFEDNCFWIYNGRSALTPFAVPTKFNTVPRELKQSFRVNGQHIQNTRKPWYLPPQEFEETETANVTQDFVYIKTEPDLYLSEDNFTIKDEPQSEPETEINYDVGQIKIEDSWGSSEQEPLPIVFPVVKEEIKEEPEDNTYSLPPSNFARLSSTSVAKARRLNPYQHNKINKTTQEVQRLDPVLHKVTKTVENKQPAVQCSPKKQRIRKRRRPREEGLLSDHTYVKLKLGCQIKVGSIGNDFSREKSPSFSKYSHVSVQCGESVFAQNDFHVKTPKKTKLTNSKMGFGSGVGRNLSTSEILKSYNPEVNMKKKVKTGSPGNTRRISKFPSVTFSNSKCKIGLVFNEKQGKLRFCKELSETFDKEKESPAEEDCNKENALSTVIKRDFLEKPHNVLDVGQRTEVKNECPSVGDCKKNGNLIKDQKFSDSFPLKSFDMDQKFVASRSLKQRKRNNSARRNHWHQRKKKLHNSLVKHKRSVASIEANLTSENKITDPSLTNEMLNGQSNAEEKFVKKEVTEPHLCLLCEESFACQKSLRIHVVKHCQKSAFACIHCAKTFVDAESLRSHIATHVLHKCVLCSAELPSKSALCEHVLSHFGETVLKCEHCPKTFYGTKLLEEHQLLHAAMSEYACRTCKKVVATEIEYFEHMKSHLNVKSVSESCNETVPFVETAPMRNGILPIENKTIKVSDKYVLKNCIVGGLTVSEYHKTCVGTRTRTECQRLKTDNETTKMGDNCTSLSKKTTIKGGLLCAICCEVCITEAEYREHVLRHKRVSFPDPAQGKLAIPVKCMLCEKKFSNERVLKKHILVHTGEFQQSCAIVQSLDR